jgi:hypothetical protein
MHEDGNFAQRFGTVISLFTPKFPSIYTKLDEHY